MLEPAETADLSCSRPMGRVPAGPPSRRSPPFSGGSARMPRRCGPVGVER